MSHSVLYVEDDYVQATLVTTVLEDEGFHVCHHVDGREALQLLDQDHFDIVLTDHYMPLMSGMELIESIQQSSRKLPVVIMTAASDVSLAFAALKAGATDFVSKDSDGNYLAVISQVLRRSLEQHGLQQQAAELTRHLEELKDLSYITLDAINQGVVTLNEHTQVLHSNAAFNSRFGLASSAQIEGLDLDALIELIADHCLGNTEQQAARLKRLAQQCLQDRRTRLEIELSHAVLELRAERLGDRGHVLTLTDITQQKEQLNTLDSVINQAPVAMLAVDTQGNVVLANRRAVELLESEEQTLLKTGIDAFIPQELQQVNGNWVTNFFSADDLNRLVMRDGLDTQLLTAKEQLIPVEISLNSIQLGGLYCVLATVVDIRHRIQAERLIRHAHELTQSIIEHSPFAIIATDLAGEVLAVSPALEKLLWYRRDELINKVNAVVFHDEKELQTRAEDLSDELGKTIKPTFKTLIAKAERGVVEGTEWTYVRKDGSTLPVNVTVAILRNKEGAVTGFLLVAYDISEQKRANEYIEHIAHHDGLTGLPNRTLMQDRLLSCLLRAKRQGDKVGVLVMDLDHFKRINDSLGHMAGDNLLKEVAARLTAAVRESDTVCRMGGDEFVVILPDVKHQDDLTVICNKILDVMAKPINVGINNIVVTTSLGVCVAPEDGTTPEELLKHADIAMYHAKQKGRNRYQIFNLDLAKTNLKNLALEQALHSAVLEDRLELHYQPQIDVRTRSLRGVEALIRWFDSEHGQIPPSEFIPMAETTGFIVTLGEWVLNRACRDIQILRQQHNADYRVAVNVSPRQFEDLNFVETVDRALRSSGLPPHALEIEITEGLLVNQNETSTEKLQALNRLGVLLAIDDFGTGYSSLSYVSRYPINIIKIDRTFMAVEDKANQAIVSAITAMAAGLEIEVIAEGVETAKQLEFIQSRGCNIIQGFYFSPAVPQDRLDKTIRDIRALPSHLVRVK